MKIQIKKVHPDAKIPAYAHSGDAGMDMFASQEVTIAPHTQIAVPTGVSMAIPEGYVGLLWDKSGLSIKQGLKTLGGVIDASYRGEILVGIVNLSSVAYTFKKGDKVAQMLIQEVGRAELEEVEVLSETPRGEGGFGSTGL